MPVLFATLQGRFSLVSIVIFVGGGFSLDLSIFGAIGGKNKIAKI